MALHALLSCVLRDSVSSSSGRRRTQRLTSHASHRTNLSSPPLIAPLLSNSCSTTAETREAELRATLSVLQKESTTASKAARSAETSSSTLDARLVRAQEEVDRLKQALQSEKTAAAELAASHRREVDTLQSSLRRAEKQRLEVLAAFRKALKLVDVLKRQKIHMEAARMLNFTEQEFSKILELTV